MKCYELSGAFLDLICHHHIALEKCNIQFQGLVVYFYQLRYFLHEIFFFFAFLQKELYIYFFAQDPGTERARRVWTSLNVGTEIYVSQNGETAEWTVSDFDVLVPKGDTYDSAY